MLHRTSTTLPPAFFACTPPPPHSLLHDRPFSPPFPWPPQPHLLLQPVAQVAALLAVNDDAPRLAVAAADALLLAAIADDAIRRRQAGEQRPVPLPPREGGRRRRSCRRLLRDGAAGWAVPAALLRCGLAAQGGQSPQGRGSGRSAAQEGGQAVQGGRRSLHCFGFGAMVKGEGRDGDWSCALRLPRQ